MVDEIMSSENAFDLSCFKYIFPPNAREQEQLDIMMRNEYSDRDPLAPEYIGNKVLFETEYWFITENRFPYVGTEKQFLIVASQPVYSIDGLTAEMWEDLRGVWKKIRDEYGLNGGAFCFRFGDPSRSGASLKRLHAHIVMPVRDKKVKFNIGGRSTLRDGLKMLGSDEV